MIRITIDRNDNNKLHCSAFMHAIPDDGTQYPKNEGYQIYLKKQYIGEATLQESRSMPIKNLTMSLAQVTAATTPRGLLARTFPGSAQDPDTKLRLLCFRFLKKG